MIRIDVPFPSGNLNAHNKGDWRIKATPIRDARQLAKYLASDRENESVGQRAVIHYTFRVPDNRRRDIANLIQSCKPYVDGIVDSGKLKDDCWQVLSLGNVEVEIDKKSPGVLIVVEGV